MVQMVAIPTEFRKRQGVLSKEVADKLSVTGTEANVDLVLKTQGNIDVKKNGAVAVVASIRRGRVEGMSFVVRGATFQSLTQLNTLVKNADEDVFLRTKIKMDKFKFPAGGAEPRNVSKWLDSADIDWEMVAMIGEEMQVLDPKDREERNVDKVKFCVRGTLVADCKKAVMYVSIIPVAASEVAAKVATWGVEISEASPEIPGLPLAMEGVAKSKYGMVLEVGPLEKAEHGLNMGWLPLLDFGTPESVAEEK